jgi:hypothetical protein
LNIGLPLQARKMKGSPGRFAQVTPWFKFNRPQAVRSVAGVAGRQAEVDPAGGKASHSAKGGTGKHVFVQRIRDKRAASGPGKPARCRVLHATGKGCGEKSEDDKRLPHGELPRWFVVVVADFTARSRISKRFLNPLACRIAFS